MRILISTPTERTVGGAEQYVGCAVEAFTKGGHRVALLTESEGPRERSSLASAGVDACWVLDRDPASWQSAAAWRPDVIFSQGLAIPAHEAELLRLAPVVLAAHDYRGQCISGFKRLGRLQAACGRTLGPACLLHYFPDRCGGRNPLTMIASYRRAAAHRNLFGEYAAVITLSEHMQRACVAHGARPQSTLAIPPAGASHTAHAGAPVLPDSIPGAEWRLLFVGRLEPLKGGDLLIDAAMALTGRTAARIRVSFVGDGTARAAWASRAALACSTVERLTITFEGWLASSDVERAFDSSHLLVVPSVWPEPYGLVGVEAARHGVPAVGFPMGGIPEWLIDGVTGRLARLPPTASSLTDAIADVLGRPDAYARMRRHAAAAWARDTSPHFARVIEVLERVSKGVAADAGSGAAGLAVS
jgi:glycosyltransferase involved in cell wall biosynthesis